MGYITYYYTRVWSPYPELSIPFMGYKTIINLLSNDLTPSFNSLYGIPTLLNSPNNAIPLSIPFMGYLFTLLHNLYKVFASFNSLYGIHIVGTRVSIPKALIFQFPLWDTHLG